MGPGLFFQLKPKQKISLTIYYDQVFQEESLSDISNSIIMEDGALVHKGVCTKPHKGMKWTEYLHPSNSPDLNPIENIWTWMKHEITTKYMYVMSKAEMQRVMIEMWENF
jgi:transposase